MPVDEIENLVEDPTRGSRHVNQIVACSRDDYQVGKIPKAGGFTERTQQRREVLSLVGPRDGQDDRLLRVEEEPLEILDHRRIGPPRWWRAKPAEIHPRWDDLHAFRLIVVVPLVLLLDLLSGAGDDQGGRLEGALFGFDALGETVAVLQRLGIGVPFEQPLPLDAAEGVAREHKGQSEHFGQLRADITGIRVVAVDDIRCAPHRPDVADELVPHTVQIGPQAFLAKVSPR